MKVFYIIALITVFSEARSQDWQPIFNGQDFSNWIHVGNGSFEIENGMLKSQGGMGLLYYTPKKIGNAQIKILYKGADKNNAGVFIRIPEKPTEAWMPVNKGYEVQIDDREDEFHSTGVLYSLTRAKAKPGIPNEWNEMIITLDGNHTTVHVNEMLITDFTEGDKVPDKKLDYEPDRGPRPDMGYIGLQNHGDDDVIYFKEVSIKPLSKSSVIW